MSWAAATWRDRNETQSIHQREDGTRAQAHDVIRLPEARHLVVDAKRALLAQEESATAERKEDCEAALARHLASLRAHLEGVSAKSDDAVD